MNKTINNFKFKDIILKLFINEKHFDKLQIMFWSYE